MAQQISCMDILRFKCMCAGLHICEAQRTCIWNRRRRFLRTSNNCSVYFIRSNMYPKKDFVHPYNFEVWWDDSFSQKIIETDTSKYYSDFSFLHVVTLSLGTSACRMDIFGVRWTATGIPSVSEWWINSIRYFSVSSRGLYWSTRRRHNLFVALYVANARERRESHLLCGQNNIRFLSRSQNGGWDANWINQRGPAKMWVLGFWCS